MYLSLEPSALEAEMGPTISWPRDLGVTLYPLELHQAMGGERGWLPFLAQIRDMVGL